MIVDVLGAALGGAVKVSVSGQSIQTFDMSVAGGVGAVVGLGVGAKIFAGLGYSLQKGAIETASVSGKVAGLNISTSASDILDKTGERRVIGYLLSPVMQTVKEAGRER